MITVIDDGDGIPQSMHEHVFEPRVTSKLDTSHMDAWGLHGRGMALFSIAENAECAYVVNSDLGLGCAIRVETDTRRLPEKTDQSGFPRFELTNEGSVNVRGPRNILRTACEFAIESRDSCMVFVGSPAEISSTIYAYGTSTLSAIDRAFCHDTCQLPLIKRLATSSDPDDFATIAASLGLELSSRTARRIIDGSISELDSLLDLIEIEHSTRSSKSGMRKAGKRQHIKMQKDEVDSLAQSVAEAFSPIAERYYLDDKVNPQVRVGNDRITISIPIVEID